jgi:hypothetical protein
MPSSISIRGKVCPTHEVINKLLNCGLDKKTAHKVCLEFGITNFMHTWSHALALREKRYEQNIREKCDTQEGKNLSRG